MAAPASPSLSPQPDGAGQIRFNLIKELVEGVDMYKGTRPASTITAVSLTDKSVTVDTTEKIGNIVNDHKFTATL
jgi:hypothetical protein